jgi:ornithine carbamoyltransferase
VKSDVPLSELFRGNTLRRHDFLGIQGKKPAQLLQVLHLAQRFKADYLTNDRNRWREQRDLLWGLEGTLVFEKDSLRTRASFQGAMTRLGATSYYYRDKLGVRESIKDFALCLSEMVHVIIARTYVHETLLELAQWANVPVINALCNREHPCQALGDMLTVLEEFGEVAGVELAFIGDGNNNVTHSLMLLAAKLGAHISIASPEDYQPHPELLAYARTCASSTGSRVRVLQDPMEAATNAKVVVTDVHVSMGKEDEAPERLAALAGHRVTQEVMSQAAPNAIFLHCLPAKRGQEVDAQVIDGGSSRIYKEAGNRLWAQMALLALILEV